VKVSQNLKKNSQRLNWQLKTQAECFKYYVETMLLITSGMVLRIARYMAEKIPYRKWVN